MHRDEDDHKVIYGSVGKLYERGATIRWSAVAPRTGRPIALPPYAWQRKRYWLTRTPTRRETVAPAAARADACVDMLYKAAWTEAPTGLGSARTVGRHIIVAGRTAASATFAAALDAALTAAGGYALVVSDDDLAAALDRASRATTAWSGIIHCVALDAPATNSITAATLTADPVPGRESLLAIVRSLDAGAWKGEPRLRVVTRGASVVSADDRASLSVAQAPLSALVRVIHVEHPALSAAWIDVDPSAALARQAVDVIAGLSGDDDEPAIAFRGDRRFLQRLAPLSDSPTTSRVAFRPDASYVVTGGLGGVGLHAARWMIAKGARHLLILGRTPLPPRALWRDRDGEAEKSKSPHVAAMLELEALGASVHYAAADAGDAVALIGSAVAVARRCASGHWRHRALRRHIRVRPADWTWTRVDRPRVRGQGTCGVAAPQPRSRGGVVAALLVDGGVHANGRVRRLCGRKCIPGCACRVSTRRRPPRRERGLGSVEGGDRLRAGKSS